MPTGKVKWYDSEKGFGFLATEEGDEVFLNAARPLFPEDDERPAEDLGGGGGEAEENGRQHRFSLRAS